MSSRKKEIAELKEKLAQLEAMEAIEPEEWVIQEERKPAEYWMSDGVFTIDIGGNVTLLVSRDDTEDENVNIHNRLKRLAHFPAMLRFMKELSCEKDIEDQVLEARRILSLMGGGAG